MTTSEHITHHAYCVLFVALTIRCSLRLIYTALYAHSLLIVMLTLYCSSQSSCTAHHAHSILLITLADIRLLITLSLHWSLAHSTLFITLTLRCSPLSIYLAHHAHLPQLTTLYTAHHAKRFTVHHAHVTAHPLTLCCSTSSGYRTHSLLYRAVR